MMEVKNCHQKGCGSFLPLPTSLPLSLLPSLPPSLPTCTNAHPLIDLSTGPGSRCWGSSNHMRASLMVVKQRCFSSLLREGGKDGGREGERKGGRRMSEFSARSAQSGSPPLPFLPPSFPPSLPLLWEKRAGEVIIVHGARDDSLKEKRKGGGREGGS